MLYCDCVISANRDHTFIDLNGGFRLQGILQELILQESQSSLSEETLSRFR